MHNIMTVNERIEVYRDMMIDGECTTSDFIRTLYDIGFFTAPASSKYHGAYEGGLFDHSTFVTDTLVYLTEKLGLKWERPESPYIVGMFHDLCKCDMYYHPVDPEYTGLCGEQFLSKDWAVRKDSLLCGHGDKSVMLLANILPLTNEEMACIRYHMGAFTDKSEWNYYTNAVSKYPNVLWTHTADMYASHVEGC